MKYFWRIYSGAFLGIILVAFLWIALSPELEFRWVGISPGVTMLFFILLAILVVPFVGLFAFSWGKPLGFSWIWKVIFWIVALTQFIAVVRSVLGGTMLCSSGEWCDVIGLVVRFLLGLPFIIGLYLYAYRSPNIWKKQNE
jgi:hypothetical protein